MYAFTKQTRKRFNLEMLTSFSEMLFVKVHTVGFRILIKLPNVCLMRLLVETTNERELSISQSKPMGLI